MGACFKMNNVIKAAFIFCLISCGVLALAYSGVIVYTIVTAPPMPFCDEIDMSKPRPVGYRYYCKGREKKPTALKVRGLVRNGILLEFEQQ